MGTMSTGSGAGGGGGTSVRLSSTIIKVALWVVVGKELGFQRDALSTAVWVSGMRAGGSATLWTQEIWVLWGRHGGCGLLVILLSGCGGEAFSSQSSSWENCKLAFSSSPMTHRNSGPPAVAARLLSASLSMRPVRVCALLA